MAETNVAIDLLGTQITEAWNELLMARIDFDHSPNADTERTVIYAEGRVNRLLERVVGKMTPQQLAEAYERPMRPSDAVVS